jgi:hypothetical protein
LSILFSIGSAGFLKDCADCCAVAGARANARRLNMLESRFINMDSYRRYTRIASKHKFGQHRSLVFRWEGGGVFGKGKWCKPCVSTLSQLAESGSADS